MKALCQPNTRGVCEQCGRRVRAGVRTSCRAHVPTASVRRDPGAPVGLVHQAWSYARAVAAWKLAGSPTRDAAEIDRVFAICEVCHHFAPNSKRPHCKLCGCSLSRAPDGLRNKIAMATESCPLDPPQWTAAAPKSPPANR